MARILAISSQVARGHVGLSAIVPALQALGHDVVGMPTMLLSNHPGHAHVAGLRVPPDDLQRMLDAWTANGWLVDIDIVLTGYLPTVGHVAFAAEAVACLRMVRGSPRVVVDPVLGDDPKGLYIDRSAAEAIRDTLLPMADVLTPNRFELAWLTGQNITDLDGAARAAGSLAIPSVIVTSASRRAAGLVPSVPPPRNGEGNQTACSNTARQEIVSLLAAEGQAICAAVPWREQVPHGTGDLLAGLVAGHLAAGRGVADAFARAIGGVEVVVADSIGREELALVSCLPALTTARPWPTEPLP